MSKIKSTKGPQVMQQAVMKREAMLAGRGLEVETGQADVLFLHERGITRAVVVTHITTLIYNVIPAGGPWWLRVGGQEFPVCEASARKVAEALGFTLEQMMKAQHA